MRELRNSSKNSLVQVLWEWEIVLHLHSQYGNNGSVIEVEQYDHSNRVYKGLGIISRFFFEKLWDSKISFIFASALRKRLSFRLEKV